MAEPSKSPLYTFGETRIHRILIRILLAVMIIEWVVLLIEQSWLSLFLDTTMQKPMLGDPSDLTDTMWDMIVNAVGPSLSAEPTGGISKK
ncbi:MAG: hypothetical protein WEA58_02225 [Balneolaceae bacterium]